MKKWFKKLLFRFLGWAKQRFERFLMEAKATADLEALDEPA